MVWRTLIFIHTFLLCNNVNKKLKFTHPSLKKVNILNIHVNIVEVF